MKTECEEPTAVTLSKTPMLTRYRLKLCYSLALLSSNTTLYYNMVQKINVAFSPNTTFISRISKACCLLLLHHQWSQGVVG